MNFLRFLFTILNKVSLIKSQKKRIKTPIISKEIKLQSKLLRDAKPLTISNFCTVNIDVRFYSATFR
jgi:hypothetical protein